MLALCALITREQLVLNTSEEEHQTDTHTLRLRLRQKDRKKVLQKLIKEGVSKMNYWKSKLLPQLKKAFDKNGIKKAAAAEASKSFDDSKEELNKLFEEKKTELQPKVLQIYEASPPQLKALVKEPKEAGLKKNSAAVQKFLDELAKIDFPGAKLVSEASSKFGPALVSGPVSFIFEKVSSFIPAEEKPAVEAASEATTTTTKDKEIVTEGGKKEEPAAVAEAAATTTTTEKEEPASEPAPAAPAAPATEETPTKVEPVAEQPKA